MTSHLHWELLGVTEQRDTRQSADPLSTWGHTLETRVPSVLRLQSSIFEVYSKGQQPLAACYVLHAGSQAAFAVGLSFLLSPSSA